jgi:hypothetical protein
MSSSTVYIEKPAVWVMCKKGEHDEKYDVNDEKYDEIWLEYDMT